jgi:hypothetical protein
LAETPPAPTVKSIARVASDATLRIEVMVILPSISV